MPVFLSALMGISYTYRLLLGIVASTTLLFLGTNAQGGQKFDLPLANVLILTFAWIPNVVLTFGPIMMFVLLYGDILTCLITWADFLTKALKRQRLIGMHQISAEEVRIILGGCKQFIAALSRYRLP